MENSEILLQHAIDAMNEASIPKASWSIGGGTVLAKYYNHRLSKDIDVFIIDAQYLSQLSPRFNSAVEDAKYYLEMTNFISLSFKEGKVDFITSGQLTEFSPKISNFMNKMVPLDDPVEIVTKKIFYRSEKLLPRDIFDLAIVYNSDRKDDLVKSTLNLGDKASFFINKFEAKQDSLNETMFSKNFEHLLLPDGLKIKGQEVNIGKKFVDELKLILNKEKNNKLRSTTDITKAIINEAKNTTDLKVIKKYIISQISGCDTITKKAKFRTALKQACKNPTVKKIVEKSQDLER